MSSAGFERHTEEHINTPIGTKKITQQQRWGKSQRYNYAYCYNNIY